MGKFWDEIEQMNVTEKFKQYEYSKDGEGINGAVYVKISTLCVVRKDGLRS